MREFAVMFGLPMIVYIKASSKAEARRIFDNPQIRTEEQHVMLEEFHDDEVGQALPYVITGVVEVD